MKSSQGLTNQPQPLHRYPGLVHRVETTRQLDPTDLDTVRSFLDDVASADGREPLSDHVYLDLVNGGSDGFIALLVRDPEQAGLIAYAQVSTANESRVFEMIVHPQHRDELAAIGSALIEAATTTIAADGGGELTWWVHQPTATHRTLAAAAGMGIDRTLAQMRRPLPTGLPVTVSTRDYVVGDDDDAWLRVNNRAFADHGEQGGWTLDTLRQRQQDAWFDPAGFRIHEIDGRIAAFCWTKVHPAAGDQPEIGEIYVIAVDPDFHGRGLGKQLTLAGLEHLAAAGITTALLYVDADNTTAVTMYERLGFSVTANDIAFHCTVAAAEPRALPRWNVSDVHESLDARSFTDAVERVGADVDRLVTTFDELGIRSVDRAIEPADGQRADQAISEYNRVSAALDLLETYVYSIVSTNSRDEQAQAVMSELDTTGSMLRPLLARLADWVASLDADALAEISTEADDHLGPLRRFAERAAHQMPESDEHLYASLSTTGSSAWSRLQADVTSQLSTSVVLPDGPAVLPMPAVRGLGTHADPAVREAAYDAELHAWPTIEVPVAAALNAIKGEANTINRRRHWPSPLDASCFANSVSRATFDAMHRAVTDSLPDFHRWMQVKARLHGHAAERGLPWWDLVAPLPFTSGAVSWDEGVGIVRDAFTEYSPSLGGLVDRALTEEWIDAEPRDGKQGGAFCMSFGGDRSLVMLNWSGSTESAQTTAHELGHAYHNTTLAGRTPLQRRLPMALAETASIFCETLVVEAGLARLDGDERLALLDVDLQGTNQVVVDIRSRFLFETEVFARRRRRTLSPAELCEMMNDAQRQAYGTGIDQATLHPYMWLLKPHYYGSHLYNWPYTYGLLFGLGLFARYQQDPERFRSGYDTLLSRVGMDSAEQLGAAFELDVTDEAFWVSSLDVVRNRMAEYERLAAPHLA